MAEQQTTAAACPLSPAELAEWNRLQLLNPYSVAKQRKKRQRSDVDPAAHREAAKAHGLAMAAFVNELTPEKRAYVKLQVC